MHRPITTGRRFTATGGRKGRWPPRGQTAAEDPDVPGTVYGAPENMQTAADDDGDPRKSHGTTRLTPPPVPPLPHAAIGDGQRGRVHTLHFPRRGTHADTVFTTPPTFHDPPE